ncbi:unnamed protein product [Victoria cruziana]
MALYLLFFGFLLVSSCGADSTADDKQALLRFLSAVHRPARVQWNASSPTACSWVGVVCDAVSFRVVELHLPGVGLVGSIPPSTIGSLTQLRVISLRSNLLSGQLPDDFANLKLLRSLYLQHNLVSGTFPPFIPSLPRLNRLDLSFNRLSGRVPFAVNNLTHLKGLLLHNNSFSGAIPAIDIPGLTSLNLSNNQFNGSVPRPLQRFPAEAFAGNVDLCGPPLPVLCSPFFPSPPAPSPSSPSPQAGHRRRLSRAATIVIAILCALLLLLLLLAVLFLCLRRKQRAAGTAKPPTRVVEAAGGPSSSKDEFLSSGQEAERNKLVFFNGGVYSFDLEDLLRASAEVLGKGSVGTSYKAVLEEGTTVVVKRLKDVAVGKKEFEAQMEVLGRIQHTNLVPIRAYYYSKDEKLLVLDYMQAGSLSSLLHGSRGSGRTPLDWDNRMKIVVHSARGLTQLHETAKTVHGNIKASNILLRPNLDACVSDFGLTPLFSNSTTPPTARVAGYRAPEVVETRKLTYKSDVYSFGVLLLELLTGKSPNQASLNDQGIDLPRWVQSVVREEWTAEVFDVELMRYQNIEEEMVQLLQIAMACVATMPDHRPHMRDVLRMIEDINRVDTDDGQRQSSDDRSKGSGGRTPPEIRTPPAGATP